MTDPERASVFPTLTPEHIASLTGYELAAIYDAHILRDVTASQRFRDHVTQLEGTHHKINVMCSLFVDGENQTKWGIFVRRQSANRTQVAGAQSGSLAMWGVSTTSIHATGQSIERAP